jgi:hypothetical protein
LGCSKGASVAQEGSARKNASTVTIGNESNELRSKDAGMQTPPSQYEFNGRALTPQEMATLQALQSQVGAIPPGHYWYDALTGAAGLMGGPTAGFLPAGLMLGGSLDARASGGGDGRLTGVFINGRELHPYDVQQLSTLGPVIPGRYRWDSAGNVSTEAGMFLFNFYALIQSRGKHAFGRDSNPYYRSDASRGESTFVSQGCAAVSGRLSPSDSSSSYSYYVGCD